MEAFETLTYANVLPTERPLLWIILKIHGSISLTAGETSASITIHLSNYYIADEDKTVEKWHTRFETTLDAVHLNIFKFLEGLLREQATAEANEEFAIACHSLPKKRKVYLDMAAGIQRLVNNFPEVFLQTIFENNNI